MAVGRDESFDEVEQIAKRLAGRLKEVDQVIGETEAQIKKGKVTAQRVEENLKRAVSRGASLGGATPTGDVGPTAPTKTGGGGEGAVSNERRINDALAQRQRLVQDLIQKTERLNAIIYGRRAWDATANNFKTGSRGAIPANVPYSELRPMMEAQYRRNVQLLPEGHNALTAQSEREARQAVSDARKALTGDVSAQRSLFKALNQETSASQTAAKATQQRAGAEEAATVAVQQTAIAGLGASRALQQIGFAGRTVTAGALNFRRAMAGLGIEQIGFGGQTSSAGNINYRTLERNASTARPILGSGAVPPWDYNRYLPPHYPGPPMRPQLGVGEGGWGPNSLVVRDPNLYGRDTPGTRTGVGRPGGIGPNEVKWAKEYTAAEKAAAATSDQLRTSIAQMRVNLQDSTTAFANSSNAIRRHGALTAEWIAEAARGETTIRELGYQVGTTVGKFGGWLVAGAAVFGALDAVRQFGKGAIDASAGVNQLRRVVFQTFNASQVQENFSQLAEHFNVPIDTATQAVYGMAKAYRGDLPQALEASRAVLYSVKVGELDVADATKYLTAITQGFGLGAGGLVSVFDQINQAQNRYGVSIRDTISGVSKSAGIFKAFGGDARESATQLIALITTISRATGQTGDVAGTALQRAPNFYRRAQNQAALRAYGIDASKTINQVFSQALRISPRLTGPERADVARQLFGPQYGARVGVGLLNNVQLYNRVLRDVSPVNARNSAERELQRTLGSVTERLHRVGIEFQRLGVEAARGGALLPLGGLLSGLTGVLRLTNEIGREFNLLPNGLRMGVGLALQMYAALRLTRRFRLGDVLTGVGPNTAAFFNPNPATYSARLERKGARAYRTFLQDETARAATTEGRTQLQAMLLMQQHDQEIATATRLRSAGLITEEELLNVQARAEMASAAAEERALEATRQRVAITEEMALASQAGFRSSAVLAEVQRREATIGFGGNRMERGQEAAQRAAAGAEGSGLFIAGPGGIVGTDVARNATAAERSAAAAAAGASRTQAALLAARARVATTVGMLSEIGTTLAGFIFNPLTIGLAALIAIPEAYQSQVRHQKDVQDRLNRLSNEYGSPQAERAAANAPQNQPRKAWWQNFVQDIPTNPISNFLLGDYHHQQDEQAKLLEDAQNRANLQRKQQRRGVPVSYLPLSDIAKEFQGQIASFQAGRISSAQLQIAYRRVRTEVAASAEATRNQKGDQQKVNLAYNALRVAALATTDDASETAKLIRGSSLKNLADALGQEAAAIPVFGISNRRFGVMAQQYAAAMQRVAANPTADNLKAFQQAQQAMDATTQQWQTELQQSITLSRSPAQRNAAYATYFAQMRRAPTGGGILAVNRQRLAQDKAALARAKQGQKDIQDQIKSRQDQINDLQNAFKNDGTGSPYSPTSPGNFEGALGVNQFGRGAQAAADAQVQQQKAQVQQLKDKMQQQGRTTKRLAEAVKIRELAIKAAVQDMHDQQFDYNQQIATAESEVQAGQQSAGLPRLRYQLQQIGQRVRDAIKHYGRDSQQALQAITQQQQQEGQVVQEQLNLIQAQNAYREAGLGPRGTQRQQLQDLSRVLAFQEQHPRDYSAADILQTRTQIKQLRYDMAHGTNQEASDLINASYAFRESQLSPYDNLGKLRLEVDRARALVRTAHGKADRLNALAALGQARQALAQAAEQQAHDETDAYYALLESRTDDPVKQARLEYQRALADRRYAHTPAERNQARAEVNNRRRDLYNQVAQSRVDDITFQADIGKVTAQQEISQLQRVLHYSHLSKDMRRNIMRQIYQLQHDSQNDLELNVGDVRLPTLYDIRRLAAGGRNNNVAVQQSVVNNNNFFGERDHAKIATDVDNFTRTGLTAALRKHGSLR